MGRSTYARSLSKRKSLPCLACTGSTPTGMEVAVVGNFFPTRVRGGKYDAFNGLLLKGNCNGALAPVPYA